mmetsp:Transcript_146583/g.470285  ORF Transcript_146583/g.470285 Transcript_146583/m.470285 type:complete len:210 (+) Transcript_146583:1379-2008(+)
MSATHRTCGSANQISASACANTAHPAIPTGEAFTMPSAPNAACSVEETATTSKPRPSKASANSAARAASVSKIRTCNTPCSFSAASTARAMPPAPSTATVPTPQAAEDRRSKMPASSKACCTPRTSVLWPMSLTADAVGEELLRTSTTLTAPTPAALGSNACKCGTTATLQGIVTLKPEKPAPARQSKTAANASGSCQSTPVFSKSTSW